MDEPGKNSDVVNVKGVTELCVAGMHEARHHGQLHKDLYQSVSNLRSQGPGIIDGFSPGTDLIQQKYRVKWDQRDWAWPTEVATR